MSPSSPAIADLVLDEIQGDMIAASWPLIEPLLQRGIDRVATDGSTAKIRAGADTGRFRLWAIYRRSAPLPLLAAAATYIKETPRGSVVVIDTLGGSDLLEWMEPILAQFETLARAHGMTRIEVDGRPGWQRRLRGFSVTRVVLTKEI